VRLLFALNRVSNNTCGVKMSKYEDLVNTIGKLTKASELVKKHSKNIREQETMATAHPLMVLLQVPKPIVVDGDYDYDKINFRHYDLDDIYDSMDDVRSALIDYGHTQDEADSKLKNTERLYIKEVWDTKQAFLSMEGFNEHIRQNKHNLERPRSYIMHAFRNPEMKEVLESVHVLADATEALRTVLEDLIAREAK